MPGSTSRRGRRRAGSSDSVDSFGDRRGVVIKPLSTEGDSGKPTANILDDLLRVLDFIEDERHLVAFDLYLNIQSRLGKLKKLKQDHDQAKAEKALQGIEQVKRKSSWNRKSSKEEDTASIHFDENSYDKTVHLLRDHKEDFDLLTQRAPLLIRARDNMDDVGDDWTLAQTLFGVTTYYRREDDNSLSIKLEGELKGIPLFEQIAVLREIDLHCHWAPFVTSSLTLCHLGKLDTVGWIMLGLPNFGIARDACFRAVGCDCVAEDGSVMIVGRGVEDNITGTPDLDETSKFLADDPVLKTLDIPPVPTRMGSGRMTMKKFEAKIKVLAPDHCHTYIIANVDPNLAFIPQSLLEFVMKKMCGFLLNKMQTAAKKIIANPVRNIHAQRMRDESAFYQQWLLPKFKSIAEKNGWDVPTISAFSLSGTQKVEADKIKAKRTTKMHSFSEFQSSDAANGDGSVSTRSAPATYRGRNGSSDDDSDISSLSGTSQSIWKNNPIASYLRDIESKTQHRKERSVIEARRMAADRLRPRALPIDKKARLRELKMHKERKKRTRAMSSGASYDGSLARVDEHTEADAATVWSGRSLPYSPLNVVLKGHARESRVLVVSGLVVLLFVLLHMDRFLPDFPVASFGMWSPLLRDTVSIVYILVCGATHFLLCDVELIYAFEAFEMGMKTGEQVKTFYRGKVRLLVALGSIFLVGTSIFKAVLLAAVKASILATIRLYRSFLSSDGAACDMEASFIFDIENREQEIIESKTVPQEEVVFDAKQAIRSVIPKMFLSASDEAKATIEEATDSVKEFFENATVEELVSTEEEIESKQAFFSRISEFIFSAGGGFLAVLSSMRGLLFSVYSTFMNIVHAIFSWQMRLFVHSNIIGRSIEGLVVGVYNLYLGILSSIGSKFYSLLSIDEEQGGSMSWRDDAIGTLRNLLLYTAVFLLVVLVLVEWVSKSYRHKNVPPDSVKTSSSSIDESMTISCGGSMPIPKQKKIPAPSKSTDSTTRRRLKFRMKRKENAMDGDESD